MLQLAALTLAVVALGAPATSPASMQDCLTGAAGDIALDRQQLADVRVAINSACPCGLFDGHAGGGHADYVRCGTGVVGNAFRDGDLRKACVRTANDYLKHSSCGLDPLLDERPCIRVRGGGGKITCSIKSVARNQCHGSASQRAAACNGPHADWTSCADAADTNRDGLIGAGDSGACACHPGFADCDQQVDDGCEVDLQSDVNNCGACGRACNAPSGGGISCVNGACVATCPDGDLLCGAGEVGGGACSALPGCLQVIGLISDSTTRTQVSVAGGAFGAPAAGTYVTIVDNSIPSNPTTYTVQSTDTTEAKVWYDDWIDLDLPVKMTSFSAMVTTAVADGRHVQANVWKYEPVALSQSTSADPPNSIVLGSDGKVWINSEFTENLTMYDPSNGTATIFPFPKPATAKIFASTLFHLDQNMSWSEMGERVLQTPDGAIWTTWGGWAAYTGPNPNHSILGRFDPSTQTFRIYNLPGDNNQVNDMIWDPVRGRMWIGIEGGITSFDPATTPWQNAFDFSASLDYLWCQSPDQQGCFLQYSMDYITPPVENGRLALARDGSIWATEFSWGTRTDSYIDHLLPESGIVERYPIDPRPIGSISTGGGWGVIALPSGDIYVGDWDLGRILKLPANLVGSPTCFALRPDGSNPCLTVIPIPHIDTATQNVGAFLLAPDGTIWFSTWALAPGSQGFVVYLTAGGVVARFPIDPNGNGFCPGSIDLNFATGEIWTIDFMKRRLGHYTRVT